MANPQQLRADVEAITVSEGRQVGSPGHRQVARFLVGRLRQLGLDPYRGESFELPYEQPGMRGCNLAAVLPGLRRELPPVLVGAHYDSVLAAPCADDNAAAVAITLATAGLLARQRRERDVLVVFFDAEEPPYYLSEAMGSIRFYHDQFDARGIHCAVIQDLTGHDLTFPVPEAWSSRVQDHPAVQQLRNLVFLTGAESHSELPGLLETCPQSPFLPIVAVANSYVGDMSDHAVFRRNGVPYLFFSCGRWEHYHEPIDTPDRLSYEKMARLAWYLGLLIAGIADCELPPGEVTADTLDFELRSVAQGLGPALPLLLRLSGLRALRSRQDLDRLLLSLVNLGVTS